MQHFPIFLNLSGRRVVLAGGGEAALAKLRLLLKTDAALSVFAAAPCADLCSLAAEGRITLHRRALRPGDVTGAALFYAASEDAAEDARCADIAQAEAALVNIVDNLEDSAFITPAIVDRAPVTVAIGTEGAAPVLARAIKRDLEERLPPVLGLLARAGKAFRPVAERLAPGRARRDFWAEYYFDAGPRAVERGGIGAAKAALTDLLDAHLSRAARPGHVDFVGAGPGDPDLLTLRARRALDTADVVIHDRGVPPGILDLARSEAVTIAAGKTGAGSADIGALIVRHARAGAQVVRLKTGDANGPDREMRALRAAGLPWRIVPGIAVPGAVRVTRAAPAGPARTMHTVPPRIAAELPRTKQEIAL